MMCVSLGDIYPAGLTVSIDSLQKLWSVEMNRVRLNWIQNVLPKQSEAELWAVKLKLKFSLLNHEEDVRVYLFIIIIFCDSQCAKCFYECLPVDVWAYAGLRVCVGLSVAPWLVYDSLWTQNQSLCFSLERPCWPAVYSFTSTVSTKQKNRNKSDYIHFTELCVCCRSQTPDQYHCLFGGLTRLPSETRQSFWASLCHTTLSKIQN